MGVKIDKKKGDKEKTDYHEINEVESSRYVSESLVRNWKSKRKYKNNNKGRKFLSAVDVH